MESPSVVGPMDSHKELWIYSPRQTNVVSVHSCLDPGSDALQGYSVIPYLHSKAYFHCGRRLQKRSRNSYYFRMLRISYIYSRQHEGVIMTYLLFG